MQQPFATLADAASALRSGAVGSAELVAAALADAEVLDPLLGVYVTRFPEQALAAARAADSLPAARRGPLHGLPLAVKDNLATVEGPATVQSPAHDPHWWRGLDAPAVARLRGAGAVVLGKTTMAEYAMGRPDPSHSFPVPRNPWDPERWTGGSSTGNGAGVASGLFLGALGSDTSGSVRLPAALCGTTGLKTTFGLLPVDGCVPLSPSQDVLGPMAVTARDCGLLLDALTGSPRPAPVADAGVRGLRIGVPYGLLDTPGITAACRDAFQEALCTLRELGAEVREFDLPEFGGLLAVNAVTMLAEAFAVHGERLAADWDGHGRSFRRLAAAGGLLPAHLYLRAQYTRERLTAGLLERMNGPGGVDVIATPTWPAPARPYAQEAAPGEELNLTAVWNPTGFPALAMPMGAGPAGLPLSLQLAGRPRSEHTLIAAGEAYQSATTWHLRRATPDPRRQPTPLQDPETGPVPASPAPSAATPDDGSIDAGALLAGIGITAGPADLAVVRAVARSLLIAGRQPTA
ncbi:amidase [Streptomyces sp. P01-B04]|uniref:amidase n=1 Tax=Streptomyces poriferorum TaxID=2798799 RepID=UPI001C5DD887|nr:amidase [Streptomyces poriferorum]MBW5252274.1 amidase [Streptomyces poriferorum]MBW5255450.1 amidase [Streptomyces poriferorum]